MTVNHDQETTVRVQVVLFENDREQVLRLGSAVAASAGLAKARGIREVELAIGDCSESPVLPDGFAPSGVDELQALSYIHFNQNLGFGQAHNVLFAEGSSEIVIFLNPDVYPSPQLISSLVRTSREPKVALADARQIPFEHPKDFHPRSGDTSWASCACAIASADAFERLGGFDSDSFFLYCEDVDLSWRARLAGYRVVHSVDAVVFHDKRMGSGDGAVLPTPFEVYNSTLSRLILAHKYGRPDVISETADWIQRSGTDAQTRALRAYRSRKDEGTLPEPIARADEVAQFIDGEYARHRF